MTNASISEQRVSPGRAAHPEEWFSILMALLATVGGVVFLWKWPDYQPEMNGPIWTIPVWLGFFYVLSQIVLLLVSATQIRALGVLDSVVAIAPFIASLVTLVEWLMGHLELSAFQMITLAALLISGLSEFLLTLWIRFVINRRTIAVDPGALS